jgi:VanZ family protein
MMLEEASQFFIPARSFDAFDALANLIGVLCGEGLVRMLPARRHATG